MSPFLKYLFLAILVSATAVGLYYWDPGPVFYFSAVWIVAIVFLLWFGNKLLTKYLDKKLSWTKWGNSRFFIHLVIMLVYLLMLVNLTYYIVKISLTTDPPTVEQLVVMNVYGAVIFIPTFSIYFSLHFLRHWRESELAATRYQQENMRSQLDSLKNHIDPHFLFNNLNILSSLIDKDKQASKIFIDKFAEVYRALLRTTADDLITVADEIEFIQAYMYLIETRFPSSITFAMKVSGEAKSKMIPPLSLQMLIENAIKHNTIRENERLLIEVTSSDTELTVTNTLNERDKIGTKEGGSGLANIQKRYSYFTSQPVRITKGSTHFEVVLPLLTVEHI